ncbi:MAG: hypothetical protein N2749_00800 [Clostridia bacterium]|nr:hypothetical protein [Clostridia bacterium]
MKYNLPSFYKDYANDLEAFKILLQAYEEVFSIISDYIDQTSDDLIINKMGTYKSIPFQRIDVTDATYDISELLYKDSTNLYLQTIEYETSNLSISDKINIWNNKLTIKQKMDILDLHEKYVSFISLKDIADTNKNKTPEIIDFELYDDKGNRMIKNLDYSFKNNVLYLFRKLSTKDEYGKRIIILKNIFLDYNTPENTLGLSLKIPYDKNFTKNEYRDLMEAFLYGALGGPTVRNFNNSFKTLLYKSGFTVHDQKTNDAIKKTFWYPEHGRSRLGPFDFIVSMPVESYYDTDRYKIIKKYISMIAPAYTNYVVSPEIEYKDILDIRSSKREKISHYTSSTFKDKLLKLYKNPDYQKKIIKLLINSEPIYDLKHYITDKSPAFYEIISGLDKNSKFFGSRMLFDIYKISKEYIRNKPTKYIVDNNIKKISVLKRFAILSLFEIKGHFIRFDSGNINDDGAFCDIIRTMNSDSNKEMVFAAIKEIAYKYESIRRILQNKKIDKLTTGDAQKRILNLLITAESIYDLEHYTYDMNAMQLHGDSMFKTDKPPAFYEVLKTLDVQAKFKISKSIIDSYKEVINKQEKTKQELKLVLNNQGRFDKMNLKDNQKLIQNTTTKEITQNGGSILRYDTQDLIYDDVLYVQSDLSIPKQDNVSMYYIDSMTIKLIPKL